MTYKILFSHLIFKSFYIVLYTLGKRARFRVFTHASERKHVVDLKREMEQHFYGR